MKIKNTALLIAILIQLGCEQQLDSRLGRDLSNSNSVSVDGDYIGQVPPDSTTRIFASGIVSNGLNNRDITISPDGNEIYFVSSTPNYSYATILVVKRKNNVWNDPQVVSFGTNTNYITIEPCLSYDGNTLFYASDKPMDDSLQKGDMNIWKVERVEDSWGEPTVLDSIINTKQGEYYPSLTKNGNLYFTREEENRVNYIYRSVFHNGSFTLPEKLPVQVNCGRNRFNAYISMDESFIIIPAIGVEKEIGGTNYYISFRNYDDSWSNPLNMGSKLNNNLGRGWSASISPDGKYLFFMSSKGLPVNDIPMKLTSEFFNELQTIPQNGNSDIYWIKSDIIEELRLAAVFED